MGFSWGNWARRFWTRSVTRPLRQRRNWNPVAALELRTLLAAFTVNSTLDTVDATPGDGLALDVDGNTSLRAAVMEANALAGADTITLGVGVHQFSLTGIGEAQFSPQPAFGDIDIQSAITIEGAGAAQTTIDANLLDRAFDVGYNSSLTLRGVTVTRGQTDDGGAIRNRGVLTVENSTLTGNRATRRGGAIEVLDDTSLPLSVTLNNVAITSNLASNVGFGGGVTTAVSGLGGGLYLEAADVSINGSTLSGNSAATDGGGLYAFQGSSTSGVLTVNNSTFSANTANYGGAIRLVGIGSTTIVDSLFIGNRALYGGGGIKTSGGGNLTISRGDFEDNRTTYLADWNSNLNGGALSLNSNTSIDGTEFRNNASWGGGAIYVFSAGVTVRNSLFEGNTARPDSTSGRGGAFYAHTNASVYVINSTLVGNSSYIGGALHSSGASARWVNNTVTGNTTTLNNDFGASGAIDGGILWNSIVAGNVGLNTVAVTSQGGNVIGYSTSFPTQPTDLVGTPQTGAIDPYLLPLADNGGPTRTMALAAVSPARDRGLWIAPAPITDARGVARSGSSLDAGAYEYQNQAPTALVFMGGVTKHDQPLTGQLQGTDPDGDTLTFSAPYGPSAGTMVIQPNGQFTYTPPANVPGGGQVLFDFRVTDGHGGTSAIVRSTIQVLPNLAPTATVFAGTGIEDEVFTGQLQATDPDGNSLTFEVASAIGGTVATLPNGEFTFTPNPNFAGTGKFWMRARDQYGAYSPWVLNSIEFAPVNDAPVVADQSFSLLENSPLDFLVGTIYWTEDGPYPYQMEIISGNEDGAFRLYGPEIRVNSPELLDFETHPVFSFVVRMTDGEGLSDTATITINLQDVVVPRVAPGLYEIAENTANGTLIRPVTLLTSLETGQTVTYSIESDPSGGGFAIDPVTGMLSVAEGSRLDYEGNSWFVMQIRTTDNSDPSLYAVGSFQVSILNVNEAPVITSGSAFNVVENTTAVTTVTATDPDTGATLTYGIAGGADSALFTINPSTGELALLAAPDFEVPTDDGANNVYDVLVGVSDGTNPVVSQAIAVTATNVFEPPPASLSAALDGSGNLVVTDTDATGKNNGLTISNDGSGNIVITDDAEEFASNGGIAGAVLSNGNRTLTVPVASITGTTVIVNGALGNDSLNASLATSLGKVLNFIGGTGGSDSLTLGGGSTTSVTHALTNVNDGSITLAGAIAGTINYTGLEPVTDNLLATDRVFTFNGGAETISLTDGMTRDGQMTIDSNQSESVSFANPTGSLTINAGTGSDIVNISSVDGAFNASLTINGGTNNDTINLSADITFASGSNLDVDLQNDDVAPGIDIINVGPNANLSLSGSGAATLNASRNIALASGSSISTVDGDITLTANSAGVAIAGSGIRLDGATIQATGIGHVGLDGHGGGASTATHQHGVLVQGGGQVLSASGNVTIVGYGGLGGIANRGVTVAGAGSRIATVNGAISVTGTAGAWSGIGDGRFQEGVKVEFGAAIEATANGTVTIVGTGGSAGGQYNRGINIESAGSRVSVVHGDLFLTGNAGATNSSYNDGVLVWNGGIMRSSGAGNIVIAGTGGGNNALAGLNRGTQIEGTLEATGTGSITMTGTEGVGSESFGIYVGTGYSVTTINQPITLAANSLSLTGVINAGTSAVAVHQRTSQTQINLGAGDSAGVLGLTDAELDRITAGTVQIGDTNSGAITVSAVISPENYNTLAIGNNVTFAGTGGFSSDVGPAASNYEKISVTGTVAIAAGASLAVASTGGYVYDGTESFTLLTNDAGDLITGAFTGPTLTNFLGSALPAVTNYTGGTGNDLVIFTPPNVAPTAVVLTPTTASLPENSSTASASVLATISLTDDGQGTNVLSLSGADASSFEIVGNSLQLKAGVVLDFETKSSYSVTVEVDDASLGGAPDASATFTLNISDVNEAPVIEDRVYTVYENTLNTNRIAFITGTDVDAGQTLTYAITSSSLPGAFVIDSATGEVTIADSSLLDFESVTSATLVVTATDSGNPALSSSATVMIAILDANERPIIIDQYFTVAENAASGTVVATVIASDIDAGQSLTYSITHSAPISGAFAIDAATGQITVADGSLLNFEGLSAVALTVTVTDNGNPSLSHSAIVLVTLTDVNEAPTIADQSLSVYENTLNTNRIAFITGTDVDAGQTLTYAITSSSLPGAFVIDSATGEVTIADSSLLDFESVTSATLVVTATDSGNPALSSSATVTIAILDANERPIIVDQFFTVAENAAVGTFVGTVVSSDFDAGQTLTYAITASAPISGAFAINPTTGEITVANGSLLNFEAISGVALTVTVTDNGNPALSLSAVVVVTLTDVNEAPTMASRSFTVAENTANGTLVGTMVGSDVDAGQTLIYSIVSSSLSGAFSINASTGAITVSNSALLNYESVTSATLAIRVTDNGNPALSATGTATIAITNVNETPNIVNQSFSLAENSANGTVVGTVAASDVDAGQTLAYSVVSGNTSGAFTLNATTGRITVANAAALDFETTPTFSLTVRVTDNGNPALSRTAVVTISLTDIVEPLIVMLDVVPGDSSNSFKRTAKFNVAILSTATFNAQQINVTTIRFGKLGTENSLVRNNQGTPSFFYQDINGDGRLDLVVKIDGAKTGLAVGDTLAKFTGLMTNGRQLLGSSAVIVKRA